MRFSKSIPVGQNFLGRCFRRKGHGGKAPKEKRKDRNHHFTVTEPDMVPQHQPPHPRGTLSQSSGLSGWLLRNKSSRIWGAGSRGYCTAGPGPNRANKGREEKGLGWKSTWHLRPPQSSDQRWILPQLSFPCPTAPLSFWPGWLKALPSHPTFIKAVLSHNFSVSDIPQPPKFCFN